MKLKINFIFSIILLFAFQSYGQNRINDPKLVEYRKAYPELDALMKKGILTEDVSGVKYFTGYSYKTLYDHIGDTEHRNSPGQGQAGPYSNNTGRNDIVSLKVAYDTSSVYFYAETEKDISPSTDKNWMLLFVDADQQKENGWEGYDLVINSVVTDTKMTTLSWLNKDGSIVKSVSVPYQVSQNKLMIKVKRSDLSKNKNLAFDFHWADNIQKIGDITEFFLNGDNAPERRANYRFQQL